MNDKYTPGLWSRNIKPGRKYSTVFSGRNIHVRSKVPALGLSGKRGKKHMKKLEVIQCASSLKWFIEENGLMDTDHHYNSEKEAQFIKDKIELHRWCKTNRLGCQCGCQNELDEEDENFLEV